MKRIKILILSLFLLLETSCRNNSPEMILDIKSNRTVIAMSNFGTAFTIDLPNIDNILIYASASFGHIGKYPDRLEYIVVEEKEDIKRIGGYEAAMDENGEFYKYGFIEAIIYQNDYISGYCLLGFKNYLPFLNNYDYRINYVRTLYDKSLSFEETYDELNKDKSFYSANYFLIP